MRRDNAIPLMRIMRIPKNFKKDEKDVHGIFLADGRAGLNLEPDAYAPRSFPAQVRLRSTATIFPFFLS